MVRRDLTPAQLPAALCAAAREDPATEPQPPGGAGGAGGAGAAGAAGAAGGAGGEGGSHVSPGGLARLLAVICQVRGPTPTPVWLPLTSVP